MTLWKIHCEEDKYPGMWQRWFLNQCVAVGWCDKLGYPLEGIPKGRKPRHWKGWVRARKALLDIKVGDYVIVTLRKNRIGRLGTVTGKAIEDKQWDPLVSPKAHPPDGQMGRRIFVRWDLTMGPNDPEMVVALPEGTRFNIGELLPTICRIRSVSLDDLKRVMNDRSNWVGLMSQFAYERALSEYIAAYPQRLEDGLLPYPNKETREHVFDDKSRSDVLLIDRDAVAVVVECKQGQPRIQDLEQLRKYLRNFKDETKQKARGILVHGGARNLTREVKEAANKVPLVELVQHRLDVEFARSN